VSPLAPFEGRYAIPGFRLERRWSDARQLSADDRDALIDLIRTAFNGEPSWFALPVGPEDHFDWKYRESPLGTTATCIIDDDARIIGFIGRVRRTWLVQGQPLVARHGFDQCQLPEWQGKGIQRAIEPYRDHELHPSETFVLGEYSHPADRHLAGERGARAPANQAHDFIYLFRPLQRMLGRVGRSWRSSDEQMAATQQVSNTAAVIRGRQRRRRHQLNGRLRRSISFARSLLDRRRAVRNVGWSIASIDRFEPQHDAFLKEALDQFDFIGERSVEYLNWRFCDERAGPFTVRVARDDQEFLGYAVLGLKGKHPFIGDILVREGRSDVAESLVRDAVALARAGQAESLRVRLPRRHAYRAALARAGIFDVGPVAGEMFDLWGRAVPAFAVLEDEDARVHYTFSDSDYF
jgi:hypothetical protein